MFLIFILGSVSVFTYFIDLKSIQRDQPTDGQLTWNRVFLDSFFNYQWNPQSSDNRESRCVDGRAVMNLKCINVRRGLFVAKAIRDGRKKVRYVIY